ncbi:MAG TPA: glycosyltransferase family 39 protein, partial [Planctomycetota bacterium]|nr:glycosyltransferase family 39 protein [Planctomycetota bacterium]
MIPATEMSEPADSPRGFARWLPAAIIACSCAWGLSSFGFHDNLEGLNADVALEMLHRGDPILPRLNGVPYLEKPPLLYWLIAASFRLFGPSEASARLIPLIAAMATLGLLGYWITRRGGPWLGWLTCLAFATSAGVLVMTRMAT